MRAGAVEGEVKQLEEDFFAGNRSMGFNLSIAMVNWEMLHFVVGVC